LKRNVNFYQSINCFDSFTNKLLFAYCFDIYETLFFKVLLSPKKLFILAVGLSRHPRDA